MMSKTIYILGMLLCVCAEAMAQFVVYKDGKATYVMKDDCPDSISMQPPVKNYKNVADGSAYNDIHLYLDDYDFLKNYLPNKNLHLGVAADAADFAKASSEAYLHTTQNFNEVTARSEMTMGECVDNVGDMQFGTVKKFVKRAGDEGIAVFGHSLAWHVCQPLKYLKPLTVGQKSLVGNDDHEEPALVVEDDLTKRDSHPYYIFGYTPEYDATNGLNSVYPNDSYQYIILDDISTQEDYIYQVTVEIKGEGTGSFKAYMRWGWTDNMSVSTDISFSSEWETKTFTFDGPVKGTNCCIVFFPDDLTTTFYVKNIKVSHYNMYKYEPLSPQQQYDNVYHAMDKWINGMMEATAGNVTAWNVVNEPLSGVDKDGDGYYDLWHSDDADEASRKVCFYWQDYLGDINYIRAAVGSARRHFAEHGGNASDLKLFINEYNLESYWDDNKKAKSLVSWIEKWENDSVKIDGIGTQMHISFCEDADSQATLEEHIEKMFDILAKSGKLIRISELDMGYTDKSGHTLYENEINDDQHRQMAEFYKWIVKKYFEIIPEAQQYGITFWCLTDSSYSSWRMREPTGLFDLDYYRKHTYGGVADGLQNKE